MLHFRKAAFISALIAGAFLASPAAAFFFANSDHALRAGPGGQTAIAGRVAEGQRIGIIKCRDKWCLVAAGRKSGWLEVRFIGVAADPKSRNKGALVVMNWLNFMPSVVRHGLDFRGVSAFETPVRIIAFPLMAACAIALAARGQRPGLATLLVSIPTLYSVFAVIAFGIGVVLYGF